MLRLLLINKSIEIDPKTRCIIISSSDNVTYLYNEYFRWENQPSLFLDVCIPNDYFRDILLSRLLKFIEEYQGDLILKTIEPVPETICSRFIEWRKNFKKPENPSFLNSYLDRVSQVNADKIKNILAR